MNKEKLINSAVVFSLLFGGNALANKDSNGNDVVLEKTRSEVSVSGTFEESLIQDGFTTSVNAKIITPWLGISVFGQNADGSRRQDPYFANITTAGSFYRDAFDKEDGDAQVFGFGFGGEKMSGDWFINAGAKFGKFEASTDIDISELGAQKEDGTFYGFKFGALNIVDDLGLFVGFSRVDENEKSNYGSISSEDITSENIGLRVRVPIVKGLLSVEPNFEVIKEESFAEYFGTTSADILSIGRRVESDERRVGLDIILYKDFLAKEYFKLGGGVVSGNQRHEYENSDVSGFFVNFEYGLGNDGEGNFIEPKSKLYFSYSEIDSDFTETSYPAIHPTFGIPIDLYFSEQRDEKKLKLGYESDSFGVEINGRESFKSGGVRAVVPLIGNLEVPIADASLDERLWGVSAYKNIGDSWSVNFSYERSFDDENKEAFSLGLSYKF